MNTLKRDFIVIANSWSAGLDNPTSKHRIAIELIRQGHCVLWIEGAGMRTPNARSSNDRLRAIKKVISACRGARRAVVERQPQGVGDQRALSDIWILSPLFIPVPSYEFVRRLNGLICRVTMRYWTWRLGFKNPVLINYVPVLAEAMRPKFGGLHVVYHCVDRWDAFAMYDSAMMGDMDRRCCRYADLVIASAGELYERCLSVNPRTILIPHGVDWGHFRQALTAGSTQALSSMPVIGFFGLLSEWVDQDLLLKLAATFPRVKIVLLGKADVPVKRLEGVPNIRLLGPKPFSELPVHIAGFTVGIIPFVVNDLTRSVNPIKLREMLSAGCPVVSTALPEVERYAGGTAKTSVRSDCVQVAHTHDDFLEMVRRILDSPLTQRERIALSDSMANETWEAKVREILKWVKGKL